MVHVKNVYDEGCLRFSFPIDWHVSHYDKTTFYREKLKKVGGDSKAVDFVAQSPDNALWLIEVKDFRKHRIENKKRITSGDLVNEVIAKALDTIAGLWISHYLQDAELAPFTSVRPDRPVRVMLWLEEDHPLSRLNPKQKSQTDMEIALRKRLKLIGIRGTFGSMSISGKVDWMVESISHTTSDQIRE